jgi:hypothetical protein
MRRTTRVNPRDREVSMADSKPNIDRHVECEDVSSAHQDRPDSVQAGQTPLYGKHPTGGTRDAAVAREDEMSPVGGSGVVDEEPGPDDADGLPENAQRRVPS